MSQVWFNENSPTNSRLLALYNDGLPVREIAERLSLTSSGVRNRLFAARRLGFVQSSRVVKRHDSLDADILSMYDQGLTYDDIAGQLGASRTLVNSRVRALRQEGKIVGQRKRGLKDGHKFNLVKEARLLNRLDALLAEQHRQEFLNRSRPNAWVQRGDYEPL